MKIKTKEALVAGFGPVLFIVPSFFLHPILYLVWVIVLWKLVGKFLNYEKGTL